MTKVKQPPIKCYYWNISEVTADEKKVAIPLKVESLS